MTVRRPLGEPLVTPSEAAKGVIGMGVGEVLGGALAVDGAGRLIDDLVQQHTAQAAIETGGVNAIVATSDGGLTTAAESLNHANVDVGDAIIETSMGLLMFVGGGLLAYGAAKARYLRLGLSRAEAHHRALGVATLGVSHLFVRRRSSDVPAEQ